MDNLQEDIQHYSFVPSNCAHRLQIDERSKGTRSVQSGLVVAVHMPKWTKQQYEVYLSNNNQMQNEWWRNRYRVY